MRKEEEREKEEREKKEREKNLVKKHGINIAHASPIAHNRVHFNRLRSSSFLFVVCWFVCGVEMGNQKSKGGAEDAGAALEDVKKLSKIMHVSEKQLAKMQKSFKSQCKVRLWFLLIARFLSVIWLSVWYELR